MMHRLFTFFVLVTLSFSTINTLYTDNAAAAGTTSNGVTDLLNDYYQEFDQVNAPDSNCYRDSRQTKQQNSLRKYYIELLK